MSKEATEFFRKERLALEQEAKRAKEQNKALNQELERVKGKIEKAYDIGVDAGMDMAEGRHMDDSEFQDKLQELTNNQ